MFPPGRIDRCEIRGFVDSYFRWLSESELDAIIRRCDTDSDEALSYIEFSEIVSGGNTIVTTHVMTHHSPRRSSPLKHTSSHHRISIPSKFFSNFYLTLI